MTPGERLKGAMVYSVAAAASAVFVGLLTDASVAEIVGAAFRSGTFMAAGYFIGSGEAMEAQ